jgi:hypothetical protein
VSFPPRFIAATGISQREAIFLRVESKSVGEKWIVSFEPYIPVSSSQIASVKLSTAVQLKVNKLRCTVWSQMLHPITPQCNQSSLVPHAIAPSPYEPLFSLVGRQVSLVLVKSTVFSSRSTLVPLRMLSRSLVGGNGGYGDEMETVFSPIAQRLGALVHSHSQFKPASPLEINDWDTEKEASMCLSAQRDWNQTAVSFEVQRIRLESLVNAPETEFNIVLASKTAGSFFVIIFFRKLNIYCVFCQ